MLMSKSAFLITAPIRYASAATATKTANKIPEIYSETSEDGVKMTCIKSPTLSNGLSRVVAVFKAGSRNEERSIDRGLAHLIRRSFGLSTESNTGINLTRHLEQMGAVAKVHGTREHMIYTVDVAPNLASRAGYLLTHMATNTAFYHWELKNQANKLIRHDIDLLNRANFGELGLDLLHEAAFGNHPEGTRLGRSLYSTYDRVGSYSYDQITDFMKHSVTPGKCAITLMNLGDGHSHMDPRESLREIKSGLHFHPPQAKDLSYKHDFVGGEIRKDIALAPSTHVMLAFHCPGGRKNLANHLALAIASHALQGGLHNISYADAGSRASRLAKTGELADFPDFMTQCGSLYHAYSDHGLFGVAIAGSCGRATAARVQAVVQALRELSKSGLTAEEVQRGKALVKSELALKTEDFGRNAVDISLQMLETGSVRDNAAIGAELDKITAEQVNQALKQIMLPSKMAMSVVGANTSLTPPLSLLR